MTQVIYKDGDLFSSDAPGLAHGVNTKGAMGAGVAVLFKRAYPDMFEQYAMLCGKHAFGAGETFIYPAGEGKYVYNIASQDFPGPNAKLSWLTKGIRAALEHADTRGVDRIALPRIGAGIGGLDWEDVKTVLEEQAAQFTCDLEVWTL